MNPQLKKSFPVILILFLAGLTFAIRQCRKGDERNASTTPVKESQHKENKIDRDRGFDRRTSYIEYSKHAKCRMECRRITESEVEEIMLHGRINYNKSEIKNARCPRYAVEGVTADDQKVRIVFAQCNEKTTVVTVIDLDTEWTCHCQGDDKKYDNKN